MQRTNCALVRGVFLSLAIVVMAAGQPPRQPSPNDTWRSTVVLPEGRVVFRLFVPKASEVSLAGDWVAQGLGAVGPMKKDGQGVWSLTVGLLAADFYADTFAVDGVRTIDPKNAMVKRGVSKLESMMEVPGPEAAFEATLPVPHGEVRAVWYNSTTLGQIKPMIVVMPNGSITLPGVVNPMGGGRGATTPEALAARIATISKLHDAFVSDLLTGIIPHVEQTYRALTTGENRALAGLSMGGAETLRAAPSNVDRFAYIGVFSMGLQEGGNAGVNADFVERNAAFFADPEKTNRRVKLFWIASGRDDRTVTDGPKRLAETLKSHGIRHEYHETEGGHTWINWRQYLRDFSQRLFR